MTKLLVPRSSQLNAKLTRSCRVDFLSLTEPVKIVSEHGKKELDRMDTPLWRRWIFVFSHQRPDLAGYFFRAVQGVQVILAVCTGTLNRSVTEVPCAEGWRSERSSISIVSPIL